MRINLENKWGRAAIPALLIHVSIGTVYCWSVFKANIATEIGATPGAVEWAFSLAIFFLGMSAAFGGKFVEKDIKKSALISLIFFVTGFLGTGLAIQMHSLIGIYVFYGVIMGIGLGIGYITPVKNLMLWFSKNKGLGTGLAVAGFGLAKVIASPIMEWMIPNIGLTGMFYSLAAVYAVFMLGGYLLLRRPKNYKVDKIKPLEVKKVLKNPVFVGIWLMFYLNITCGLALISQEKDILKAILPNLGFDVLATAAIVAIVLAVDAVFNTAGRLSFSMLSDKMKQRETSYKILFGLSILSCGLVVLTGAIGNNFLIPVLLMLFLVNAGYGGGFSTLPVLLQEKFGMKNISAIHGLTLSAWAFAGLSGNQLASFITNNLQQSYNSVVIVIGILYAIAFGIIWKIASRKKV